MVGEKIYTVRMVKVMTDRDSSFEQMYQRPVRRMVEHVVKVSANKIVEDEEHITFYDQWGDCAGRFRKDAVISFAREVEDKNG